MWQEKHGIIISTPLYTIVPRTLMQAVTDALYQAFLLVFATLILNNLNIKYYFNNNASILPSDHEFFDMLWLDLVELYSWLHWLNTVLESFL